ncbi:MAG TPA: hypothetical protein PKE06_05635 [Flavilitoribacter sp.]|nr:hypothetical protein [Flavilitoribacter sp.]HMQ87552.1 hypothetical protein [Flavilitoribacter sp.]
MAITGRGFEMSFDSRHPEGDQGLMFVAGNLFDLFFPVRNLCRHRILSNFFSVIYKVSGPG